MEGAKTENEIWYIAIDEIQEDNEKKRKKKKFCCRCRWVVKLPRADCDEI